MTLRCNATVDLIHADPISKMELCGIGSKSTHKNRKTIDFGYIDSHGNVGNRSDHVERCQRMFLFPGRAIANSLLAMVVMVSGIYPSRSEEPSVDSSQNLQGDAIILQMSESGTLELVPLNMEEPASVVTPAGLLVWKPNDGKERWLVLQAGGSWPAESESGTESPLAGNVRSGDLRGVGGLSDGGMLMATIQLEPLDGSTLIRGSGFVTPLNGAQVLSSRPTIRRSAEKGMLPAKDAIIARGSSEEVVLRIPFAEGQTSIALLEWKEWPRELENGLPPGQYSIRFDKGLERNQFTILEADQARRQQGPMQSMFEAIGSPTDLLAKQYAVEHLLSFRTDDNRPAFLGDALDLVESLPKPLPTQLQMYAVALRQWAENLAADPGYSQGQIATMPPGSDTGFALIDSARGLIAAGQWSDALQVLNERPDDAAGSDEDLLKRQNGLRMLYRAVIFAEAGTGSKDKAIAEYSRAIETLTEFRESPEGAGDLLRAHNNLGNFHLLLAQNSLGNHAFQMAAGVDQPVLTCLQNLLAARQQYMAAAKIAIELNDARATDAVRLNQARTASVLADVIRTLDVPSGDNARQFSAGEGAASKEATALAISVSNDQGHAPEPMTVAVASELLAQLAYRKRDWSAAVKHAEQARAHFLELGQLSGVETVERLLGLVSVAAQNRPEAIRHFTIAQHLAELQRARFPQDQTGQARAGYFARHSFIYEQLVELHLAEGNPKAALRSAELAKARAAQDLLTELGIGEQDEPAAPRDLDELLADWPADVAAVEYFLGAERGWGFVIRAGHVRAFPLVNADGDPIATRQLVAEVRQFLSGIEGQSQKMLRRYQSRGFDHAWQDDLFRLRSILLPDDVLAELREQSNLVVVPQHILHYLPFAALVTTRDTVPRGRKEMVQPKFVLDEPYALTSAPSLTIWDLIRRRDDTPVDQVRVVGLSNAPGSAPLAGVEEDLNNVRTIYGDKLVQVLEGTDVDETNVKQMLSEPGMLMFATHGHNIATSPMDSYLIVLKDETGDVATDEISDLQVTDINDGRLTAREIFARRVNARLIVLSACYSGLGDQSPLPGDDLFGLQRAFLHAGARSVLSGLWDVFDRTAPELVAGFHAGILAGEMPSLALAKSQRKFLNKQREAGQSNPFVHPYFWSVFSVAGAD